MSVVRCTSFGGAIVFSTAVAASAFAFFGYVLDLLNAIEINTRELVE